jgi:2-dehydro-3-deoxygluconokinase
MQRSSKVIYDRAGSAMASIKPGMIDWKLVFADASWFHWSGITPAIAGGPAEVCQEAILAAKEMDLTVSCDLNFRKNLWKWGRKPSEVMPMLVEGCDIVIGNEEAAEEMLGIRVPRTYWKARKVEAHRYLPICQSITEHFPNVQTIAITLRGSLSASQNTWSGLLWHQGQIIASHRYHLTHIVDRIGGGDAFVAGLIYGFNTYRGDLEKTLNFATAASCLKHSIFGDFNLVTVSEVENLLSGDDSGRISR